MGPILAVSASQICRAESCPQSIGKLGEITAGNEGISKRLLLLSREWEQRRLPDCASLDAAGDRIVRGKGSRTLGCFREYRDWRESFQRRDIGVRLGSSRPVCQPGEQSDEKKYLSCHLPPSICRIASLQA
jgi:hypothetical protein